MLCWNSKSDQFYLFCKHLWAVKLLLPQTSAQYRYKIVVLCESCFGDSYLIHTSCIFCHLDIMDMIDLLQCMYFFSNSTKLLQLLAWKYTGKAFLQLQIFCNPNFYLPYAIKKKYIFLKIFIKKSKK